MRFNTSVMQIVVYIFFVKLRARRILLCWFYLSDLTAVIMEYRKKSVYVAYAVGMIPFKMFLGVLKTVRKTNVFNYRSQL